MRFFTLIFIILIPYELLAQEGEGIIFDGNRTWAEIKKQANEQNKYIFMDVFATWCMPCKRMDAEVYLNDSLGRFMNEKFVSVRIQMDSTGSDNSYVKKWYRDARLIADSFKIKGYPSFLFFSPKGVLLYKDIGFKDLYQFMAMDSIVLDPLRTKFYLFTDKYVSGIKNYSIMADLAEFVRSVLKNEDLAVKMALDYKSNYLDNLSESELISKRNLDFLYDFNFVMHPWDGFFKVFYEDPERIDSIVRHPGWAKWMVDNVITREEISNRLKVQKGSDKRYPDWRGFQSEIQRKYPREDARRLVLDYEIYFYRYTDLNWSEYARVKDDKIKEYPYLLNSGWNTFLTLNYNGAWDVFIHCNIRDVLGRALAWINLAISLDTNEEMQVGYKDTKANLLYKLGKVKEAISCEQDALTLSNAIAKRQGTEKGPYKDEISEALENMKEEKPTYTYQGAVWSQQSLQEIKK